MANRSAKKVRLHLEKLEARDCPTAGALDPTFGNGGFALADFHPTRGEYSQTLAIQPDGKMVVAGYAYQAPTQKSSLSQDFALARFNVDGTLDTSFGSGGKVLLDFGSTSEQAMAVSIVTEPGMHYGKIAVAGESGTKIAVARFNSNGSLDSSFDGDGKVLKSLPNGARSYGGSSILPLPGGKLLIGGQWTSSGSKEGFALIRFNANGSLDTTFDSDGFAMPTLTTNALSESAARVSLAQLDDGRIVAAGRLLITDYPHTASLALYHANGSLDTSFGGGDGHIEFSGSDGWRDVAVQAGRILVVGTPQSSTSEDQMFHPMIARYDLTGALDMSFGVNGLVVETISPFDGSYVSVAIQGDGKIVAAGSMSTLIGSGGPHSKIMVARYSADGALDTASFGTDDSDGLDGIVVTDTSPTYDAGIGTDLALQSDGRIVVTGSRGLDGTGNAFFSVVRYLGDDPAPLQAAAAPTRISNQNITQAQLAPLFTEAIARWRSAGFIVTSLGNINLRIADLPGTTLGQAQGSTITLDTNAAGWGWFVDKTPRSDSEFRTPGNQGEEGRMDPLSVVMHEMGHVLGRGHSDHGLMAETLAVGTRSAPALEADLALLAGVFSQDKKHRLWMN